MKTRIRAAKAATLVVTLMRVVTEVGGALVHVGVQVWNGAALILIAEPHEQQGDAGHEERVETVLPALCSAEAIWSELSVTDLAVDESHAEEQEPRGETTKQQVLPRRLLGAGLGAAEPLRMYRAMERSSIAKKDDHQAAGRRGSSSLSPQRGSASSTRRSGGRGD